MSKIEEISPGVYATKTAIISTTQEDVEPDAIANAKSKNEYATWGKDNNYPATVMNLVKDETTSSGNLAFKEAAHYGGGLIYYTRKFENGKEVITPIDISTDAVYSEVKEFLWRNDIENYLQGMIADYEKWNICYTELIPNALNDKIHSINWKKTSKIRAKLQNAKGKITKYFYSSHWPKPKGPLPSFIVLSRTNAAHFKKHGIAKRMIYAAQKVSSDRDYYPSPYWHSSFKFMNLAKKVSTWMIANLDNAANIKYHIEIPESYFFNIHPIERYGEADGGITAQLKAVKDEKEKIFAVIDSVLTGAENASKFFYTMFAMDPNDPSKQLPGWKINELKNDVKDAAFIVTYETAASAIATAHNVAKELSGLVGPKGLAAGSGSNVREQLNLYTSLHTVVPRQTTLEALYMVKYMNDWPADLHFGYKNIILQTLDENPTGKSQTISDGGQTS